MLILSSSYGDIVVKKVLIISLIFMLLLSACDALGISEATPAPPPEEAGVSEVGYLSKITIDLKGAYGGDYRVEIGGVPFSCRTYEDHQDQLFCFARGMCP